jgi:hypothetical protein
MTQTSITSTIRGQVAAFDEIAMSRDAAGSPSPRFEQQARELGGNLRAVLNRIVTTVVGPAPRPTAFASTLGIDKSLASMVVRAARAEDPLETLHYSPAPNGLTKLLRAAEKRGVAPELCQRVQASISDFQGLLDEFAGGRMDFEAALADLIPGATGAGMRRASQAAYRSMSYVLGYRADVTFSTSFIQPSAGGMRCDEAHVSGHLGLRLLRRSVPITLFVAGLDSSAAVTPESISWERLNGQPLGADFKNLVLPEFSSEQLPELKVLETHTQRRLQLPAGGLSVNHPIDIVQAIVLRNGHLRYRTPPENFLSSYKMQHACRVMVMDVFLHEDVCPGAEQETITRAWLPGPPLPDFEREDFSIDAVPAPVERSEFAPGLDNIGIVDIPRYGEMIDEVLGQLGWDRTQFRGHRLRCQYPLPFVTYGQLFELPEPPAGFDPGQET